MQSLFLSEDPPNFSTMILSSFILCSLPEGVEMVMPGDHVEINVKLITPVACSEGLRFAIREGGRTVGSGQITKIIDD